MKVLKTVSYELFSFLSNRREKFDQWPVLLKPYGLVIYRFYSKLVRLSKSVKVTDNRKDISLPQIFSFPVNYESIMF